ncbi:MAG: MFS transporter, partial [Candidatus Poribacteria bacterium]|nr:MFS transporter [Candidatus Poribacteria bacterium]
MVLTGGLLSAWAVAFYTYGFSALFKPISSDLGLSRATTSVAASIGRFEGGFEAPLTGWVTDRHGPRIVVIFGVFLIGLGLILMNFVTSTWTYYLFWGVIVGTGFNIAVMLPVDTAITNWFVKKRGVAQGSKWVISGLGGSVVLPFIVVPLIVNQGWRMACVVGGLGMWFINLPLAWF